MDVTRPTGPRGRPSHPRLFARPSERTLAASGAPPRAVGPHRRQMIDRARNWRPFSPVNLSPQSAGRPAVCSSVCLPADQPADRAAPARRRARTGAPPFALLPGRLSAPFAAQRSRLSRRRQKWSHQLGGRAICAPVRPCAWLLMRALFAPHGPVGLQRLRGAPRLPQPASRQPAASQLAYLPAEPRGGRSISAGRSGGARAGSAPAGPPDWAPTRAAIVAHERAQAARARGSRAARRKRPHSPTPAAPTGATQSAHQPAGDSLERPSIHE